MRIACKQAKIHGGQRNARYPKNEGVKPPLSGVKARFRGGTIAASPVTPTVKGEGTFNRLLKSGLQVKVFEKIGMDQGQAAHACFPLPFLFFSFLFEHDAENR